jgi:hypothetical protein
LFKTRVEFKKVDFSKKLYKLFLRDCGGLSDLLNGGREGGYPPYTLIRGGGEPTGSPNQPV